MAARKTKPKAQPKAKPKTPAEAELQPHKIVGQLIGARYNEHGDMVGEEVMGELAIYSANFGKVEQIINEALAQAREAQAGEQ